MHDFSWYPRQKYVYQGREVIKVEADVHSYFMGTVYNYRVTCFDGRVKRGEAQRNDFSGFLNSHNMLPAWAGEKKGPVELAEHWGFIRVELPACQRQLTDDGCEHVCYIPKEAPEASAELQGPQPGVKVFSLQIAFAAEQTCGSPVVMTATGMNGATFEVPFHSLTDTVGSVALAIERQLKLPEWLNVKLVTLSGEPLQAADMLFRALGVPCLGGEGSSAVASCGCEESSETVAQAEAFFCSLDQRIGSRDDLNPSLKQELMTIALAEAAHKDPAVEQLLHMLASELASSLICEGVSRQMAEVQAYVENLQKETKLQANLENLRRNLQKEAATNLSKQAVEHDLPTPQGSQRPTRT